MEIVRRKPGQRTFEVLPLRWVVERILAWITRFRRLAWNCERTLVHSKDMVMWAMIGLMARRLAPAPAAAEMTFVKHVLRSSRRRGAWNGQRVVLGTGEPLRPVFARGACLRLVPS